MSYADVMPAARDAGLFPDAGLADATFEGYDESRVTGASRAVVALRSWVDDAAMTRKDGSEAPSSGVILAGPTGVGKTHLLMSAARLLAAHLPPDARESGYRIIVVGEVQLRTYLRACWSSHDSADRLRRAIAGVNRSWLFYDDLGAAEGDDAYAREISDLLVRRHASPFRTCTVITTNLDLPRLEGTLGARAASRLVETALRYKLEGEDQRRPRRG